MNEVAYRVEKLEHEIKVEEYVSECVDVAKFIAFCRQCKNYGKRWSCPPFEFEPTDLWAKYDRLKLVAWFISSDNTEGEALIRALKVEKTRFLSEMLDLEGKIPNSLALGAGCCELCENCERQAERPCCMHHKERYSIEALGGDVSKTALGYFQKPLLWVKDNIAPDYLMLVGGLLIGKNVNTI